MLKFVKLWQYETSYFSLSVCGSCFCSSLSACFSFFINWHFPLQCILGFALFSQRFFAIQSWLILKDTKIHTLLNGCNKMSKLRNMTTIFFKSVAKVKIYCRLFLSLVGFVVCRVSPKMAYNGCGSGEGLLFCKLLLSRCYGLV